MPIYSFRCDFCGRTKSEFRSVAQYKDSVVCFCSRIMERDIGTDAPRVHGNKYYNTPLHSDSLAIAKSQVAEHNARWPDIEIDSEYRPVFTSFKQHDSYLQDVGFAKMKQKVRHTVAKRFRAVTVDDKVIMVEIGA